MSPRVLVHICVLAALLLCTFSAAAAALNVFGKIGFVVSLVDVLTLRVRYPKKKKTCSCLPRQRDIKLIKKKRLCRNEKKVKNIKMRKIEKN